MTRSVPGTPVKFAKGTLNISTPKSISKRTLVSLDENDSYLEEEDATYMYNETTTVSDEEEDLDYVEEEDEDEEEEGEGEDDDEYEKIDKKNIISIDGDDDVKEETKVIDSENSSISSLIPEQTEKFRQFLVKHEIPRKLFHSSIGFVTLWLYTLGFNHKALIPPIATISAGIFLNDIIRFQFPEINKSVVKFMWFIIRDKEVNQFNGTLWFTLGVLIVFTFLPKDISVMSVLLLSWADTAASTFGRQFGKYTPQITKGKSLAGSIACFFAGIISCYVLYGYFIPAYYTIVDTPEEIFWKPETSHLNLFVFSLVCGFIASVSEFINLFELDDNFTIPVLSGFFIYGVVYITNI
ncbi:cytidylyltransferase family-domain-containing protein [Scheffersomyces coipomensis]|uniref:cytidylyltransferase family-domain-containing protein n=1 Tax=Scheffersomyces coipomensis TaxID=1788519 RepID=UPI00315CF043